MDGAFLTGPAGFGPATTRLTVEGSTAELQAIIELIPVHYAMAVRT